MSKVSSGQDAKGERQEEDLHLYEIKTKVIVDKVPLISLKRDGPPTVEGGDTGVNPPDHRESVTEDECGTSGLGKAIPSMVYVVVERGLNTANVEEADRKVTATTTTETILVVNQKPDDDDYDKDQLSEEAAFHILRTQMNAKVRYRDGRRGKSLDKEGQVVVQWRQRDRVPCSKQQGRQSRGPGGFP